MDFDPEHLTVRFANHEELAGFHRELTTLLREVTVSVSAATKDAEQAQKHARALLDEFHHVAGLLTTLRRTRSVPRSSDGEPHG